MTILFDTTGYKTLSAEVVVEQDLLRFTSEQPGSALVAG
jgi:hypothetical protein